MTNEKSSWFSTFIRQNTGSWGIFIFALWALVLAVLALAQMLWLTKVVELSSNEYGNQGRVWLIFVLNALFAAGFGGSSYGLFRRQNWGRVLFLWAIGIWSGANLIAIVFFDPSSSSNSGTVVGSDIFSGIRFALSALISFWYLNLDRVKALLATPSEEFTSGEY